MNTKISKKILFIGNYLSKNRGSKGVVETITNQIDNPKLIFRLCSKFENKLVRLIDFIWSLFITKYDDIYVDIYSGKAFLFTKLAIIASKIRGKKIIGTLHGGALKEYDQKNNGIVVKTIQKIDKLQSPSKFLIHYFSQNKLTVNYLPNPISLINFKYDRSNVTDNSILSDDLNERGFHTLTLFGLDTPYRLFEKDNERVRNEILAKYLAGINQFLREPIEECLATDGNGDPCIEAMSPVDLENKIHLPKGNIFHGDLTWPFAETDDEVGQWGVETTQPNIFLCGSAAKRGGAVSGIPGHNAAMKVLETVQ